MAFSFSTETVALLMPHRSTGTQETVVMNGEVEMCNDEAATSTGSPV